jgi:pimeloyl-ACP methyl ester carboxylesterase
MGSASSAWKLITPTLAEALPVIAFDLPGHGNTSLIPGQAMDPLALAQLIRDELQEQGIERFHIAGNSLGGWVALEMAAHFPDNTLSATGIAPAGLWLTPATHRQTRGTLARYLASSTHTIAPWLMQYQWAKRIGFAVVSPLWRDLATETCIDATVAYGTSPGYFPAWDGMLNRRFDSSINASIPVTVLFGDHDNTLPAKHSQERSLLPEHARWIRISQSGHAPMWDHPEIVVQEILHGVRGADS